MGATGFEDREREMEGEAAKRETEIGRKGEGATETLSKREIII